MSYLDPMDQHALDIRISELLVATADGHDADLGRHITEALLMLRERLRMDVVFVAEFVDGQRVFRFMEGGAPMGLHTGDAAPLEQSYCQRVVQGRLPELVRDTAPFVASGDLPHTDVPVGAHLSTPVVLPDGRVYGTVCCFSAAAQPHLQQSALAGLQQCAKLVARLVHSQPDARLGMPPGGWAATEPAPFNAAP